MGHPDSEMAARDNEIAQRDNESFNRPDVSEPAQSEPTREELQARIAEMDKRDAAAKREADSTKDDEAPEDAFSHYLTLADGSTVRYDVGNEGNGHVFPTEFNGVAVTGVRNAVGPGPDDANQKADKR